jgi:hypothetical protein
MSYDGPISPPRPAKNTSASKKIEHPNVALTAFQTRLDQATQQCYFAGSYIPHTSCCLTLHLSNTTLTSNTFEFIYNRRIYWVQLEQLSKWEGHYLCQEREGVRPPQHGEYGLCHYNPFYTDPDIKNIPQAIIRQQNFKYTIHLRGFQP